MRRRYSVGGSGSSPTSSIRSVYDERLCRMWEFFLAGSEMGFRYDNLTVLQMQRAKRIGAVPLIRDYVIAAESTMRTVNTLPVRTLT